MTDIFEVLKNYNDIAISGHIRPDGDATGSCLGLYFYLKNRMPAARITVYLEKPDSAFSIIPGYEIINSDFNCEKIPDAFVVLDTTPERIGDAYQIFEKTPFKINIDHHISNKGGKCDIELILPEKSATAEVLFSVLDEAYIDDKVAELIYLGIAHDTGVFRFSNVSPDTMLIGSQLLKHSFDHQRLIDYTYFEKTYIQNVVKARVMIGSKLYCDNKFIVGIADRKLIDEYKVVKDDFDGTVNMLIETKETHGAAFLFEKEDGTCKISLRASSDLLDVSKVCEALGGGGHVRAAGCDYKGTVQEAIENIIRLVNEQLQ